MSSQDPSDTVFSSVSKTPNSDLYMCAECRRLRFGPARNLFYKQVSQRKPEEVLVFLGRGPSDTNPLVSTPWAFLNVSFLSVRLVPRRVPRGLHFVVDSGLLVLLFDLTLSWYR